MCGRFTLQFELGITDQMQQPRPSGMARRKLPPRNRSSPRHGPSWPFRRAVLRQAGNSLIAMHESGASDVVRSQRGTDTERGE